MSKSLAAFHPIPFSCSFLPFFSFRRRVTDIKVDPDTGAVTSVQCGEGESFDADAVVCAVGINGVKGIVRAAPALSKHPFFSKMMNLRSVDALAVRLYLDRRVRIPYQRSVKVANRSKSKLIVAVAL